MITIVLVVSRAEYLEKVITSIELLECDKDQTNILCIVDGDDNLYLRARNLINGTKFIERLTVRADLDDNRSRLDVPTRRRRIVAIHNQARALIKHTSGYVLSVEDDTTFGPLALHKLLDVATRTRAFGMAEGVEIGRWGIPYVGAWKADDIYEPKQFVSVENIQPVPMGQPATNIDAGGMYLSLINAELYKKHNFNSDNGLGPDLNFGIDMRQQGYENFIVWTVPCTHHTEEMGKYKAVTPKDKTAIVTLTKLHNGKWHVKS
jgi:hypothetical protein